MEGALGSTKNMEEYLHSIRNPCEKCELVWLKFLSFSPTSPVRHET